MPVGLWQAVRRNKPVDYTFTGLSFLFYAAPTFFVGTVLILVFSVKLHIVRPRGPQGGLANDLTDWRDMTLPVLTLALVTIACSPGTCARPCWTTSPRTTCAPRGPRAPRQRRVLWRHVLRNSLIPIATLLGLSLPGILSAAR